MGITTLGHTQILARTGKLSGEVTEVAHSRPSLSRVACTGRSGSVLEFAMFILAPV